MLADQVVEGVRDLVLVGTTDAQWAMSFAEGFAVRAVGIETEAVFAAQEVCEGEVVALEGGRRGRGFGGRRWAGYCGGHSFRERFAGVSRFTTHN